MNRPNRPTAPGLRTPSCPPPSRPASLSARSVRCGPRPLFCRCPSGTLQARALWRQAMRGISDRLPECLSGKLCMFLVAEAQGGGGTGVRRRSPSSVVRPMAPACPSRTAVSRTAGMRLSICWGSRSWPSPCRTPASARCNAPPGVGLRCVRARRSPAHAARGSGPARPEAALGAVLGDSKRRGRRNLRPSGTHVLTGNGPLRTGRGNRSHNLRAVRNGSVRERVRLPCLGIGGPLRACIGAARSGVGFRHVAGAPRRVVAHGMRPRTGVVHDLCIRRSACFAMSSQGREEVPEALAIWTGPVSSSQEARPTETPGTSEAAWETSGPGP